jgi:UDP-N-acetylglucosamine 2-epimerase (non-hydrolysing)
MKNICFIAGTRPEIIKVAPVIREFKIRGQKKFNTVFCATGQHKTMADQAMEIFELVPDYNLEIMSENQTLNSISAKIFSLLPPFFDKLKPDLVFVQGDTTTVAMTGLVAFNMKIPVAHIEAGLRTYNLEAPFPEELNRRIVSNFSRFNFAPTENAKNNLLIEKSDPDTIFVTGNTVVDALEMIKKKMELEAIYRNKFKVTEPFILLTAHRRESFGDGFENICKAIREIAERHRDIAFIYPVHLNPNVRIPVEKHLKGLPNIHLIEPVSYIDLLALMNSCEFCVTDSGGIQEEAPSFGKYTIVLRDFTERIESVDMGMSELVGTSFSKIVDAVERRIHIRTNEKPYKTNPFGAGNASEIIYNTIEEYFRNL